MVTPQKNDLDCSCGESDKLLKWAWPPKNLKLKIKASTFNPGGNICLAEKTIEDFIRNRKRSKTFEWSAPNFSRNWEKVQFHHRNPFEDGRLTALPDLHECVLEPLRSGGKYSWGVTLKQRELYCSRSFCCTWDRPFSYDWQRRIWAARIKPINQEKLGDKKIK